MDNGINTIKRDADQALASVEKLTTAISNLKDMTGSLSNFSLDFSSLDQGINSLSNIDGALGKIRDGYKNIKEFGFENIMSGMASQGSVLAGVYTTLNNALLGTTTAIEGQTMATTICTTATSVFGTAMEFLSNNPLMAVIGAIGLVVGALALLSGHEDTAKTKTELVAEAQAKKRKELDETTESIKDNTAASVESAKTAETQSTILRGFVDNLKGLADENGYIQNMEQAKYYVEEINKSMPGTVEITKDGKLKWLENAQAIEENIKQLEKKAKVEAYYDGYVESLKNESKLRSELTLAQNNYNAELENQKNLQSEFNELDKRRKEQGGAFSNEDLAQWHLYQNQLEESKVKLEEYSETLDSSKSAYEANKQGADLYNLAIKDMDETVLSSAELQVAEMTVMGEKGTSTWNSLAAAREDCKTRMLSSDSEEAASAAMANELINAELINKAMVFGTSCDDMINKLKERGATMSAEEEAQLRASYDMWKMSSDQINTAQSSGLDTLALMKSIAMSNMSEADRQKLAENVKLFAKSGNEQGLQLCQQLATGLSNNSGEIDEETAIILNKIVDEASKCEPETTVKVKNPSEQDYKELNKKNKEAIKPIDASVKFKSSTSGFVVGGHNISIKPYASGGFVDTGELFVAREAGPELVGRINGKTAVANNDQIVSGISSGVYNAMVGALGSSHRANTTVTAIFQVDGKQVAKQVIKAHNKEVIQTGRSPLLI